MLIHPFTALVYVFYHKLYSKEIKNIEIMANQATLSNLDNVSKFVIEIIPCEL